MAEPILTIALNGNVSLNDFAEAMKRFRALIDSLSKEIGGKERTDWRVDDLQSGSAIATFRGSAANPVIIEGVIQAYATVGKALQHHETIPYSSRTRKCALRLTDMIKGSITSIRFETSFSDAVISRESAEGTETAPISYAVGAIRGTIQMLSNRRGLRFTLYDSLFDRPISCYLREDQQEDMRGAWGRKVIVSGVIGREVEQYRPVTIRNIQSVQVLEDVPPGSFRRARGALPPGDEKSEIVIRSIRDAE